MQRGMAHWEVVMPRLIWFPDKQEAVSLDFDRNKI
ncbi:hypothetical protein cco14_10519 [Campylobacter coli 80352]|uniref:Uncharacterized protein n=1 Tax=Campylobacter coli 80352 TaxID=887288 RepID=A0ABN0EM43_CAMCO|nr:hypothetical protein cco14_10519 [Campylobacter coli 80352]